MNLDKYSREELIQIIKVLSNNNEYKLQSILLQLETEKRAIRSKTSDLLGIYQQQEQEALRKYSETLSPYKGCLAADIPHETLNKAMKYFEEAETAKQRIKDIKRRELK